MTRLTPAWAGVVIVTVFAAAALGMLGIIAYNQGWFAPTVEPETEIFERVTISVTDAYTDELVENVEIKLSNLEVFVGQTDEYGRAYFYDVPSGTYTVLLKADNYYWLERTLSIRGTTTTFGQSYKITQTPVFEIDNDDALSIDPASRLDIENTPDTQTIRFAGIFKNVRENSNAVSPVITIELVPSGVVVESVEAVGYTLTEETAGSKYTLSLSDMEGGSAVYIEFKVTLSGIDTDGDRVDITMTLDDTPTVEGDAGGQAVSAEFDIVV